MRLPFMLIALSGLLYAPAGSARGENPAETAVARTVAEIVTFRLAPGVDQAGFLRAASQTRGFVAAAPGFIARTLTRGDDGLWTDYILWRDMKAAKMMADAFMSEPSVKPFLQAIDPKSVTMRHETVLWQMQQ